MDLKHIDLREEQEKQVIEYVYNNFSGFRVGIHLSILESELLSGNEVRLYGLLLSFAHRSGIAFPSNDTISKKIRMSKSSVSKMISNLSSKNFINVKLVYKKGTMIILRREITFPIENVINDKIVIVKKKTVQYKTASKRKNYMVSEE